MTPARRKAKTDSATRSSEATTPGRPKDSGSRQQTQPNQQTQSGSAELDRQSSRKNGAEPPLIKPAGAK